MPQWLAIVAAAVLVGAAGSFGWRVFRRVSLSGPARLVPPLHEAENGEASWAASPSPPSSFELAAVEQQRVVPELPRPETIEEITDLLRPVLVPLGYSVDDPGARAA